MEFVNITNKQADIKKIAILNAYLQGGHTQIAETESATRYIEAARNLGIIAKMFANSDELDDFKPDIVVAITYQEGKLTKYPTYVSLNVPPSLIKNEARFVRNILSFDGFLTLSMSVITWLESLCHKHGKKFNYAKAAFSVPKTPFVACEFTNATAMYMGTNWDGNRHSHFFKALDGCDYLTCYGPEKSWLNYKNGLYGGEVPFDGATVINKYRTHGIGLCIGHPAFDAEGIANNRLFEVPAASALVICAENELARDQYGDSALYMDHRLNQSDYTEQFISYVEWVRSNPSIAAEMARETNRIYNSSLCMEQQILNLIDLHNIVMADKYEKNGTTADQLSHNKCQNNHDDVYLVLPKVDEIQAILPLLDDIKKQTYSDITLCFHNVSIENKRLIEQFYSDTNIHNLLFYNDIIELEKALAVFYHQNQRGWVGLLDCNVRLFNDHIATLLRGIDTNIKDRHLILKARYLEQSNFFHLPDYIQDVHKIYDENNIRLESHAPDVKCPRGIVLFSLGTTVKISIKSLYSQAYLPKYYFKNTSVNIAEEITAIVNVDSAVIGLDYSPLDRLTTKLSNGANSELIAYANKLKETIWQQEKRIKSIYATKSWMFTFPFRRLSNIITQLTKKLKTLYIYIVNLNKSQQA